MRPKTAPAGEFVPGERPVRVSSTLPSRRETPTNVRIISVPAAGAGRIYPPPPLKGHLSAPVPTRVDDRHDGLVEARMSARDSELVIGRRSWISCEQHIAGGR